METINWYVRFDKSDPAKIVKDDLSEADVPSYCHAMTLTLWKKIMMKDIEIQVIPDWFEKHDGLFGSVRLSSIVNNEPFICGKL